MKTYLLQPPLLFSRRRHLLSVSVRIHYHHRRRHRRVDLQYNKQQAVVTASPSSSDPRPDPQNQQPASLVRLRSSPSATAHDYDVQICAASVDLRHLSRLWIHARHPNQQRSAITTVSLPHSPSHATASSSTIDPPPPTKSRPNAPVQRYLILRDSPQICTQLASLVTDSTVHPFHDRLVRGSQIRRHAPAAPPRRQHHRRLLRPNPPPPSSESAATMPVSSSQICHQQQSCRLLALPQPHRNRHRPPLS